MSGGMGDAGADADADEVGHARTDGASPSCQEEQITPDHGIGSGCRSLGGDLY